MKSLINTLIAAALCLACFAGLLSANSGEALPVDINLNASYTGENSMTITVILNSKELLETKSSIRFKGGLEAPAYPDNALTLEGNSNAYVSS